MAAKMRYLKTFKHQLTPRLELILQTILRTNKRNSNNLVVNPLALDFLPLTSEVLKMKLIRKILIKSKE